MGLRSFEYLAATQEMGVTMRPGKDSFTRALIYALEALVEERPGSRFTTVELLNKIKDAPHFPEDQNPMLSDREKNRSAGRIMLHPLQSKGSDSASSREEASSLNPLKGHTLTLHIEFSEKPSPTYLEAFGRSLNEFSEFHVGINQVRWGGLSYRSLAARVAKDLQRKARRSRQQSMKLQQADSSEGFSDVRRNENSPDPLTPSSLGQQSLRTTESAARSSPEFDPAEINAMSLLRPRSSNNESEGHLRDQRERRKRRRTALDSESSA